VSDNPAVEAFAGVGIRWLREPSLLTGMRLLGTSFPSYPSAHVSVGVGALVLT
jgi:hypothetical protein